MALNFPFEMFMEAQEQKNQNQQNMNQNIAGLGQGLGQMGNAYANYKKQKALKDLIGKMLASQSGGQPQGMAGMNGVQNASQMPPQQMDPQMRIPLEMMQADPSLIQGSLPAMIKGMGRKQGGMTDYQSASLAQRDQQFQQRQKMTANIQQFKQGMDNAILGLRRAGLKDQADRLQAQEQEWIAQHWMLNALGYGPQSGQDDNQPAQDPGLQ
jgi:hypothetical protein